MQIKRGQVWASNLPGRPLLTVTSTSSIHFLFPIQLTDTKGNIYFSTNDGLLKQIVSPTGYSYKITILVSDGEDKTKPGGVSKKVRDAAEERERKIHNDRVIREYKLKGKERS